MLYMKLLPKILHHGDNDWLLTSVTKAERLAAERPMSEHTVQTDDRIATNLGNLLFRAIGWDIAEVKRLWARQTQI